MATPMLIVRSGHTSVPSLVRYARVSAEALARYHLSNAAASEALEAIELPALAV
jgi:hypothetical protein